MSHKFGRIVLIVLVLVFGGLLVAQEHGAATPTNQQHETTAPKNPDTVVEKELSTERPSAEGKAGDEEEENVNLKQSTAVKWVASHTGLSPRGAYWTLAVINFAILAGAIIWFSRLRLPAMLRNRTASIQQGIEESRKASADANLRLSEIELRLSKLDAEIGSIRAAADADFAAEEARIKQQAEEDARHVVEAAEQEIASAARSAQRELKAYAAGLAVDLAKQKIKIDREADEALVRGFASQLGKDGK